MADSRCINCGQKWSQPMRFCPNCGVPQATPTPRAEPGSGFTSAEILAETPLDPLASDEPGQREERKRATFQSGAKGMRTPALSRATLARYSTVAFCRF